MKDDIVFDIVARHVVACGLSDIINNICMYYVPIENATKHARVEATTGSLELLLVVSVLWLHPAHVCMCLRNAFMRHVKVNVRINA